MRSCAETLSGAMAYQPFLISLGGQGGHWGSPAVRRATLTTLLSQGGLRRRSFRQRGAFQTLGDPWEGSGRSLGLALRPLEAPGGPGTFLGDLRAVPREFLRDPQGLPQAFRGCLYVCCVVLGIPWGGTEGSWVILWMVSCTKPNHNANVIEGEMSHRLHHARER